MMEEKLLHFSLGPVQDFVAQAQRAIFGPDLLSSPTSQGKPYWKY